MKSIIIKNLNKSYKDVVALRDINLSVEHGEIYGLIGPDGAGKSTLFKILVTLDNADSGEAEVCGVDITKDYSIVRNIVGYMPGKFSLYQDLTVLENLRFFADIFGTTIEQGYDLIKEIWVQIEPFSNRYAGKLSGGMKQKLALCCALIHSPKILFLDEPTTGVDPVSRREFWQMLKRLKDKGITIFVSTPYMDEAILCDRVSLIQNGVIMNTGRPESIIKSFNRPLYDIKSRSAYELLKALNSWDNNHSCNAFGQSVHFSPRDKRSTKDEIISYLYSKDIMEVEIEECCATIEDCFIELMRKNNGNNN